MRALHLVVIQSLGMSFYQGSTERNEIIEMDKESSSFPFSTGDTFQDPPWVPETMESTQPDIC